MTDYSELVKALRYCSTTKGMVYCNVNCKYGWEERSKGCKDILMTDAAAAIEALQKNLKAVQTNSGINFRMWEEAQADNVELESCVRTLTEQRDYWKDKAANMEVQDADK